MATQSERSEYPAIGALPRVSVVIPTFNRAQMAARAIRSVLPNLIEGDEIIVVDDGSTDDTAAVLAQFGDRIRYIPTANFGAGAARNRGIDESRNELVAFLDSDDEWMADKLSLQRALLAMRPDVLFCFSDFAVKRPDGSVERKYLSRWHRDTRGWDRILGPVEPFAHSVGAAAGRSEFGIHVGCLYAALMSANYIPTFTLIVRREACAGARFAADLSTQEDWQYFGQIAQLGRAAFLDTETAVQWGHGGPRLTDADDYRTASARIAVLERVWGGNAAFRETHGAAYEATLARQHEICARWLLEKGRTREARKELRLAPNGRRLHRFLAAMPGPLVHAFFAIVNFCRMVFLDDYTT